MELPLREVKLDDNKSDEDFFFFSSSDIVGMVKQEFICQAFIMTEVVNFSSELTSALLKIVLALFQNDGTDK